MTEVAMITGGSRRIGKAIGLALAERGYDIALHYNNSDEAAGQAAEEIRRIGRECKTFQADLSDYRQVEGLVGSVVGAFGRCDVLVNNASIFEKASLAETTTDLLFRTMRINFEAPFMLTRDFAALCQGQGQVINLLDTRIRSNRATYCAYSISKKALADLTRLSAHELGPSIRVNGVCPGLVLEPPEVDPDSGYLEELAERIPLRRRGDVEDVVRAVVYLIDSDFVTGQLLFADGGEQLI
ncbi:MAG: SDR family oxidoreductase [Planctomycetota bacterium]